MSHNSFPETAPPVDAAGDHAPSTPTAARPLGTQAKLAVAAVAVAAVLALLWPRGDGSFEAPGGFVFDAAGHRQALAQRMAPATLVHFWSTWCPPCLTEVPALERLIEDTADRPDFEVLMVAVDDEVDAVATFLGGEPHHVLFDPQWEVAHGYGTRQLPESHLVVDGRVVESWRGSVEWDDPAVRRALDEALVNAGGAPVVRSPGSAG